MSRILPRWLRSNTVVASRRRWNRNGLSLLEMILATAILMAGALALAQLSFVTTRHAIRSQDEATALQIASYYSEQIQLGLLPLENQPLQPVLPEEGMSQLTTSMTSSQATTPPQWEDWFVSLQVRSTQRPGVVEMQLNVLRMPPSDTSLGSASSSIDSGDSTQAISGSAGLSGADQPLYERSFVRLMLETKRTSSSLEELF